MPIGGSMMLNEKDSSNALGAHEEDGRLSEAGDANVAAGDSPSIQNRNTRPHSAAIGGALGGIGGRRTKKTRLR